MCLLRSAELARRARLLRRSLRPAFLAGELAATRCAGAPLVATRGRLCDAQRPARQSRQQAQLAKAGCGGCGDLLSRAGGGALPACRLLAWGTWCCALPATCPLTRRRARFPVCRTASRLRRPLRLPPPPSSPSSPPPDSADAARTPPPVPSPSPSLPFLRPLLLSRQHQSWLVGMRSRAPLEAISTPGFPPPLAADFCCPALAPPRLPPLPLLLCGAFQDASKVDPELLFTKMDCIGKGSFGEVFKGLVLGVGVSAFFCCFSQNLGEWVYARGWAGGGVGGT